MLEHKRPALVLGGGVAGLSAALELARRGRSSLLVEQSARLGGRAAAFCCKALRTCARCGACRLGDLLEQAAARPEIEIVTQARVSAAQALEPGAWRVELVPHADPGQAAGEVPALGAPLAAPRSLEVEGLVLAVGYEPYPAAGKTRFGHGRVEGVVSALELEAALKQDLLPAAGPVKSLAFIQCVGSRDEEHLYCSRVCCGYALRLARLIKGRWPETEITFFHMDVQGYGRAWEDELAELRRDLNFVRAMPGEAVAGAHGPELVWAAPGGGQARQEFDLVVLSQGLTPPAGAAELAALFGAGRDADGFLRPAPGVAVAGAAGGPLSIRESIVQAASAAQEVAHA